MDGIEALTLVLSGDDYNFFGIVCSSTFFSTNGTSYQRLCGRARGYQKGHTASFWGYNECDETIDGAYADSLGIQYGCPRQHIWTYTIADSMKVTQT